MYLSEKWETLEELHGQQMLDFFTWVIKSKRLDYIELQAYIKDGYIIRIFEEWLKINA